jgi:hypothetical protein
MFFPPLFSVGKDDKVNYHASGLLKTTSTSFQVAVPPSSHRHDMSKTNLKASRSRKAREFELDAEERYDSYRPATKKRRGSKSEVPSRMAGTTSMSSSVAVLPPPPIDCNTEKPKIAIVDKAGKAPGTLHSSLATLASLCSQILDVEDELDPISSSSSSSSPKSLPSEEILLSDHSSSSRSSPTSI